MTRRSMLTRAAAAAATLSAAAMLCLVAAPANAGPALPVNVANYVKYSVPKALGAADNLVTGADGTIWFRTYSESSSASELAISHVSATGTVTTYPVPAGEQFVNALVLGGDGNLWFTTAKSIGRITPAGVISLFPVGEADQFQLGAMALGADGDVWVSVANVGIDKVAPDGTITRYAVGSAGDAGIATLSAGDDGNVWFTDIPESGASKVGYITAAGAVSEFPLPTGEQPQGLTTTSDGSEWAVTLKTGSTSYPTGVAKFTSTGLVGSYSTGSISADGFDGTGLVAATDGTLWQSNGGSLVHIAATGSIIGTYKSGATEVGQLYAGTDGSVTFTSGAFVSVPESEPDLEFHSISSISSSGAITPLFTTRSAQVREVATDGTGNLWFADDSDDTLGQLHPLNSSRVSGTDRYETALAIAKASYPTTAPVVYVATGANYPDALSAAPAAAHQGGPLLLTRQDGVPTDVLSEITSLAPSKIVVVGGTAAVSDTALGQLQTAVPSATVTRIGGATRFETSTEVTQNAFGSADSVFVATGRNFPDALAASAAAGKLAAPVILVTGNSAQTDSTTTGLITSLGATEVYIAGGTAAVSTGIESQLDTLVGTANVDRLQGANRYATSSAINHRFFTTASNVYLATGAGYADALAGAAAAGAQGQPLYLSQPTCLPDADATDIQTFGPAQVTLLGGTSALSAAVADLAHC